MTSPLEAADISESYLEYRATLQTPMFPVWTIPNPLIPSLHSMLAELDVNLSDITWNKDPSSVSDLQLTISILKLNAVLRVGVDTIFFSAFNPAWSEADALARLFGAVLARILQVGKTELKQQAITLAMHVKPGIEPFREALIKMVRPDVIGEAEMYGVSAYRQDFSFIIDRSSKYKGALFVRLDRTLAPNMSFEEIAKTLYTDEARVLGFVGLEDLMKG